MPAKKPKPDYGYQFFLEGLKELFAENYQAAAKLFNSALCDYETFCPASKKDETVHLFFRFFKEWTNAFADYRAGRLDSAESGFSHAVEITLELPQPFREDFLFPAQIFLKLVPLQDRLEDVLAQSKDFTQLSEELNNFMGPLGELQDEMGLENVSDTFYIILTAQLNICFVLLYLLGKLPSAVLEGIIRTGQPAKPGTASPARLVQWALAQEQLSLIEIGFERAAEIIPQVSRFAMELVHAEAPEKLSAISAERQKQLLKILEPFNSFGEAFAQSEVLKPAVEHSIEAFKNFLWEYETKLGDIVKNLPGLPGKTDASIKFPAPSGAKWADVIIDFINTHCVKITIGPVSKQYNYAELGFKNQRNGLPDSSWKLLWDLAHSNGRITWDSPAARRGLKMAISRLALKLKSIMNIPSSPFFHYKATYSYTAKFRILPSCAQAGDAEEPRFMPLKFDPEDQSSRADGPAGNTFEKRPPGYPEPDDPAG
ncbi:MAG: hypothetical protein HY811_01800 [Planctomycetes bacterium]|nr:hypothetical protein [Planctomycetota bacterium]